MIRSIVLDTVVQTGGAFSISMVGTLVIPSFATTCVNELAVNFVMLQAVHVVVLSLFLGKSSVSCSLSSLEMFRITFACTIGNMSAKLSYTDTLISIAVTGSSCVVLFL